ncbi:hypothetical protein DFH27DRAFT_621659 [Peziza echinospora]|nr:hypothetical protein DFH27DRAFT_621659 [Peziza echinospora]
MTTEPSSSFLNPTRLGRSDPLNPLFFSWFFLPFRQRLFCLPFFPFFFLRFLSFSTVGLSALPFLAPSSLSAQLYFTRFPAVLLPCGPCSLRQQSWGLQGYWVGISCCMCGPQKTLLLLSTAGKVIQSQMPSTGDGGDGGWDEDGVGQSSRVRATEGSLAENRSSWGGDGDEAAIATKTCSGGEGQGSHRHKQQAGGQAGRAWLQSREWPEKHEAGNADTHTHTHTHTVPQLGVMRGGRRWCQEAGARLAKPPWRKGCQTSPRASQAGIGYAGTGSASAASSSPGLAHRGGTRRPMACAILELTLRFGRGAASGIYTSMPSWSSFASMDLRAAAAS